MPSAGGGMALIRTQTGLLYVIDLSFAFVRGPAVDGQLLRYTDAIRTASTD